MVAGLRTITLAGLVIAGIDGFVLPDLRLKDVVPIQDPRMQALGINTEPFETLYATIIAKPGPTNSDAESATERPWEWEPRETTVADPLQMPTAESSSMQIAALGCVDKLNPDSDAGKQHEGGEALHQLVVAGGDAA